MRTQTPVPTDPLISQIIITIALVISPLQSIFAQGPGGGPSGGRIPSPEDSFQMMDRNDNDQIDPEEWESLPAPIRGMWEREGVDLASPVTYDDFIDKAESMRSRMLGSGRGPGGGGSPMGPGNGGNSPGGDRGRGGPRGGPAGMPGGGGDDDNSGPSSDSKEEKPIPKARLKMTMKLPESYRSRDKDNDGQIGLYEWPRNDYAGFKKLDHNGDGFLTPQELSRGPRTMTVASNSRASSTTSSSSSGSSGSTPAGSSPTSSGSKSAAEKAFDLLDKDKNTTISEDEWKKSMSTGPAFKKAGIGVSFPLPRGEFLRLYPQAYPPK